MKPIVINEQTLKKIIYNVLLEASDWWNEEDSRDTDMEDYNRDVTSDIEAIEDYKRVNGEHSLDYKSCHDGAFLLTNGKLVYIKYHHYLNDIYGIGEILGAIRMSRIQSREGGAVEVFKEPTPQQYEAIKNGVIQHYMYGLNYRLEIDNINVFDSEERQKLSEIENACGYNHNNEEIDAKNKFGIDFKIRDLPSNLQQEFRNLYCDMHFFSYPVIRMYRDSDPYKVIKSHWLKKEDFERIYNDALNRLITLVDKAKKYLENKKEFLRNPDVSNEITICARNIAPLIISVTPKETFHQMLYLLANSLHKAIEQNKIYIHDGNSPQNIATLIYENCYDNMVTVFMGLHEESAIIYGLRILERFKENKQNVMEHIQTLIKQFILNNIK